MVYDASTNTMFHVAPVATSGPNAKKVRVLAVHAPSVEHPVAKTLETADRVGEALVLDENDPTSKGAFRLCTSSKPEGGSEGHTKKE